MESNHMLTLPGLNKKIQALGIKAELVKGNGYFYFSGDDVQYAFCASVCVFRINHLDEKQWLDSLKEIVQDSVNRNPM